MVVGLNRGVLSTSVRLTGSIRQRVTPYTERIEALGVSDYSIVNHMILPKGFGRSLEEDYWHLKEFVQVWDVSCQRQVELSGPDARNLLQKMTPRDVACTRMGDCLYVPLIDENAGMVNDPVVLKLDDDHFWLSISDSDVLLWAKGLALGFGMDVTVQEPDVSPLAVQGPLAENTLVKVFGDALRDIPFFGFGRFAFENRNLVVARSGYSKQGGFEIYLDDSRYGAALWDAVWEAGQEFNVAPGSPNLIERIEAGLLSYGNEMTRENNPLECRMDKYCSLELEVDCIGWKSLQEIAGKGPERRICGLVFGGEPVGNCRTPRPVSVEGQTVGSITTMAYSPRLESNIGMGMLDRGYQQPGQECRVEAEDGSVRSGRVVSLPMSE